MKKFLKKQLVIICMLALFVLGGCGNSNTAGDNANDVEYLEGYDDLSEEETTKKMIEEADKMEVVPDDKE